MVSKTMSLVVCLPLLAGSLLAEDQAQAPAAAPAPAGQAAAAPAAPAGPPAKNPWAIGPFVFSALLDGYYSYNGNSPGNEVNVIRNFDARSNQPTISIAKFSLDAAPAPIGFHIDAGFGRTLNLIEQSAPGGPLDGWQQLLQAYVSLKPKDWKGFQADFGKFYTSAGAEVTETNQNWNYSRSILFALAPYYHTGLRTSMPITKTYTAGVQVVEGWNGYDGKNHGVTLGLTSAWNPNAKVGLANNYYVGPEDYFGLKTTRNFFDTVVTLNPNAATNIYVNFDIGHDRLPGKLGKANYYGGAVAARYGFAKKFAISPRIEIYRDSDGFWTGTSQNIKEFTFTGEYKHNDYFLTRLEVRHDWSDHPLFFDGPKNLLAGNQTTFLVGMVIYVGPKKQ